jgi:PAT family beta-lactamase induction signal transducer AmpG
MRGIFAVERDAATRPPVSVRVPATFPAVTLSTSPLLRIATLCALYVAQGIPYGFVVYTLAAYFAEQGLDAEAIGSTLAMGMIPWAFKWAFGPVVDRWSILSMGRRRPWILLAQAGMIATILAMASVPDPAQALPAIGILILLHNTFNALQDVSVDALAVDLLTEAERGKANGLMYGSKYLGTSIGAAGLGVLIGPLGMAATMVVQATLLGAIMLLPLLVRERPGERLLPWTSGAASPQAERLEERSFGSLVMDLVRAFSLRSSLLAAAVAVLALLPSGLLAPIANILFIQDLGWSKEEYVAITGTLGVWAGLGGSIAGGFLADLVGPRRLAGIAAVLLGAMIAAFGWLDALWTDRAFLVAYLVLESGLLAVLNVSLFALFMAVSWPRVAATQFTAYMALLNLSTTIGLKLAGPLDARLDFASIYLVAGVLQAAVVLVLPFIDPAQARRALEVREPE